ncbi:MAG TPA: DUF6186 family protein [Acidimicrobiales bacterium]|nr:DUF6186 family protein [Acidimicrobiales bacterium]
MIGRDGTFLVWALLGAALAASQIAASASGGRFPGLGTLARRVTARPAGRILLVLGWMWLGWHAFAR